MIDDFKYEEEDGYMVCKQCKKDIISTPRCMTWGGTFDRKIEDPHQLNYQIDFFLIGQNPWYSKDLEKSGNFYGRAFGAKSEQILIDYITRHKIDHSKIWISNAVQCSVINNDIKLVEKAFENCKKYLEKEIELVKPKLLVPMGNTAFKLTIELNTNIKIYKILHPNATSYKSDLKEVYDRQFETMKRKIS